MLYAVGWTGTGGVQSAALLTFTPCPHVPFLQALQLHPDKQQQAGATGVGITGGSTEDAAAAAAARFVRVAAAYKLLTEQRRG